MKKTKVIIPALGLLLLSTAASVSGTVAWFSMNNFVNATEMKVTAKAENGIVISNQASASGEGVSWNESATAAHNQGLSVFPTSTATAATWVHSKSNDKDLANTNNPYESLTIVDDSGTGAGYVNDNGQSGYQATAGQTEGNDPVSYAADSAYYLMNSFYIKSSADIALTSTNLYITKVIASTTTSHSTDLNKALRVLVRLAGDASTAKVYAPFRDTDSTYTVVTTPGETNTTASVTAIAPGQNGIVNTSFLSNTTIPASSGTPLQINIYLYYEGEDAECKSANLTADIDELQVQVEFGTQQRQ